jgi:hypothetical protein
MVFDDSRSRNHDRLNRRALGVWLTGFPWQLFITLTFAKQVGELRADQTFHTFIDRLERCHRAPIGWIRGDEHRWSGCGMPAIRRHYHSLLCSDVPLDPRTVLNAWHDLGNFGRNADIRKYDPTGWATEYCVKFVGQPGGDWDLSHNLGLFTRTASTGGNHRMRRRWLRHQLRLARVK